MEFYKCSNMLNTQFSSFRFRHKKYAYKNFINNMRFTKLFMNFKLNYKITTIKISLGHWVRDTGEGHEHLPLENIQDHHAPSQYTDARVYNRVEKTKLTLIEKTTVSVIHERRQAILWINRISHYSKVEVITCTEDRGRWWSRKIRKCRTNFLGKRVPLS